MRSIEPPKAARWFLNHFGCSTDNNAIVGDLDERYRRGRTGIWYWRQALIAILASMANEIRNHRLLTLRAVAIGWTALLLFIVLVPVILGGINAVVAAIVESRLTSGSTGLGELSRYFHIQENFFRFHVPWKLSLAMFTAILCAGFASAGWIVARLHRPHRRAMVLAFVASQATVMLLLYKGNDNLLFGIAGLISTLWGGGFFRAPAESDSNRREVTTAERA
jgi:hypothetical protein